MNVARYFQIGAVIVFVSGVALLLHPLGIVGKNLWPPSDICPLPTAAQFPFFVVLAIVEAGALGLGTAFAIWGYQFVKLFKYRWQRICVYLGLTWHMTNWALHDGFHQIAGVNLNRILYIEYAFHMTLIIATCGLITALMVQRPYQRTNSS